ncbi:hydroxyacid dehydrogenase [Halobacteriovorax sp. GB3]|uniref:hydroxyacid dehydrogenase n=1 Tax=Halobacteriovorax sp. GB3 TaxID=2719615 RepID=UPI00235F7CCE|nr:hydroxyacid dehydrogenase [Halobacteriovorax sp. GB3]MDD0854890.1 hydroxyacid dehydrogenase [Halobacteriovorax sp. GB3]
MKPFIVVSDGMDKDVFANLQEQAEFEVHPKAKLTQDELKELLPKVNALVIRSATTVDAELLKSAPNLKYVIRAGEGTDNIDKVKCEELGVKVSNTPGANNNSAAEHAIALMMTVLRKTAYAHSTMKNGGWDKSKYTGLELANKKIGVVGFGRIGQIVAKRLSGFEPEVLFFDPFLEKSDIPYATKAKDLEEIFSTCDVITLHTPLMDSTRGLVDEKLLGLMKPDSVLVNASRGGIVNEEALFNILNEGKIRGAGFDVYATEPLEENSKLRTLENLVMTPHLGAATEEAQIRVGAMAFDQLKEFFLNENLVNEVKA